jgi:hypothetical protein
MGATTPDTAATPDMAAAMTEPRPSRRPGAAPVFWAGIVLFAALFALLTYRFSIGRDPSLAGAGVEAPPARKVIERRVVTTVVAATGEAPASAPSTVTSAPVAGEAAASTSPPVTTSAS